MHPSNWSKSGKIVQKRSKSIQTCQNQLKLHNTGQGHLCRTMVTAAAVAGGHRMISAWITVLTVAPLASGGVIRISSFDILMNVIITSYKYKEECKRTHLLLFWICRKGTSPMWLEPKRWLGLLGQCDPFVRFSFHHIVMLLYCHLVGTDPMWRQGIALAGTVALITKEQTCQ